MKTSRLHNLDYLRGLAAFGIMVYHYYAWAPGDTSIELFINKLGLYGVALFYVLSGLTLFHVYSNKMILAKNNMADFFIKRFFRIMPLLWAVTITTIIIKGWPGIEKVFLNITGLFGIIKPSGNIGIGVWSIGNELVFYLFFPLFIYLYKWKKLVLIFFSIIVLCVYLYFAYYLMAAFESKTASWSTYVNPLNQIFLFLSGFLIGVFFQHQYFRNFHMIMLFTLSITIFALYPTSGDEINILTGNNRIIYTLLCIMMCLALYKFSYRLPNILDKPLRILGEISYSLYLLHPLVWAIAGTVLVKYVDISRPISLIICGVLSLICSYISFQIFEKYFIKLGRQVSNNFINKPEHELVRQ